jgi:hypothetical protein
VNADDDISLDEDDANNDLLMEGGDNVEVNANVTGADDNGYDWEDYQDDISSSEETETTTVPPVAPVLRGLRPDYLPGLSGVRRALDCEESIVCYNKCDVDSISVTSSSLLKLIFRVGSDSSKFTMSTKINVLSVDVSSRAYIKVVQNDSRIERAVFKPRNRSDTGVQRVIRLCRFKNICIGNCLVGASKFSHFFLQQLR